MKKICAIIMIAIMSLGLIGANNVVNAKAKKVKLNKKSVTINVGEKKIIKLKNVNKKVKWKVKNKKIAKIVSKKKKYKNQITIKAIKKGKTFVVATYKGKKYKVKINVNENNDASIIPETTRPLEETTAVEIPTETTKAVETKEDVELIFTCVNNSLYNIKIVNNTNQSFLIGYDGYFEKYVNGEWTAAFEPGDVIYNVEERLFEVKANGCYEFNIGINVSAEVNYSTDKVLEPGHYRYVHKVNGKVLCAEFDI